MTETDDLAETLRAEAARHERLAQLYGRRAADSRARADECRSAAEKVERLDHGRERS